jgi:hypothetical protein
MNRAKKALAAAIFLGGLMSLPFGASVFAAGSVKTGSTLQRHAQLLTYVASVEGVTPAVLQQDLAAGQTLLQIAGNKYASAGDLATALLSRFKTRMDAAVSSNKLTASQENTLYTQLHSRVATLVVTPHPTLRMLFAGQHKAAGARVGGMMSGVLNTMVATCNTTAAALKTAFQAGGKTPLAICQATNPGETQAGLVTALMGAVKTKLDAAVNAKTITAAQESQLLTRAQTHFNKWVTTTIPVGGRRHA